MKSNRKSDFKGFSI